MAEAPRSTWSHCGSLAALDHRVEVSPSTAAAAVVTAFSAEEATAGLPCDNRAGAALADRGRAVLTQAMSRVRAAITTVVTAGCTAVRARGLMGRLLFTGTAERRRDATVVRRDGTPDPGG
ncbi:hypothetical protein Airi01_090490 [Actinoallomurus iriomotensis]|uniref:Uncharacterized protein n=1 Tax=Actinoallomurus iriomotensis TaxID=478107 RepID=A0A9W6VVP2_9ACTN|nr:hypothetical protein Airi01_090490 [Actinoallomurus iriomotensis]